MTPYPGQGRDLTLAQAKANLDYLLQERPARLKIFGELLKDFGLDLEAGLTADDPRPFLEDVVAWIGETWPSIHRKSLVTTFWIGNPGGATPQFSLVMDLAIMFGEMILRRRPDYVWGLDLERSNKVMSSWRRPCVLRPSAPGRGLEFEAWAYGEYKRCASPTYRVGNGLAGAIAGWIAEGREAEGAGDVAARAEPAMDTGLIYCGLRFEVSEDGLADLESGADPRIVAAGEAGLQHDWGHVDGAPRPYALWAGVKLGPMGGDHAGELVLSGVAFQALVDDVATRLGAAGLTGEPRLHMEWRGRA